MIIWVYLHREFMLLKKPAWGYILDEFKFEYSIKFQYEQELF